MRPKQISSANVDDMSREPNHALLCEEALPETASRLTALVSCRVTSIQRRRTNTSEEQHGRRANFDRTPQDQQLSNWKKQKQRKSMNYFAPSSLMSSRIRLSLRLGLRVSLSKKPLARFVAQHHNGTCRRNLDDARRSPREQRPDTLAIDDISHHFKCSRMSLGWGRTVLAGGS